MNVQTKLLAALALGVLATPVPMVLAAPGQVTSTVNVRSGPGIHHRVLGQLPGGQVVDVTGCQGGWCHVALAGGSGWISARIVSPSAVTGAPRATAYAGTAPLPAYGRAVAYGGAAPIEPYGPAVAYGEVPPPTGWVPWAFGYGRGMAFFPASWGPAATALGAETLPSAGPYGRAIAFAGSPEGFDYGAAIALGSLGPSAPGMAAFNSLNYPPEGPQ